jgi:putative selenate reductase molybdopterin-binding subunit
LTILESEDGHEIHGIGETSLPPVMPAIANAVYRATGVRITDLPVTPEKVLRGLHQREAG